MKNEPNRVLAAEFESTLLTSASIVNGGLWDGVMVIGVDHILA